MNELVVFFVVFDVIIMAAVVMFILKRRRAAAGLTPHAGGGVVSVENFRALAQFAKDKHEQIGNYVQANWSGIPDQLPGVLTSLLDTLVRDAEVKGLPTDRDTLKILLATSLRAHKIGRGNDVRDALAKVA